MKILVSNHSLKQAGGTETFTYTLIGELKRLGHQVEYFCLEKGAFSERIEKDFGVSFKSKKQYDLILANHNTTVNKLHKYGLTIQTCHGIYPRLEQPSSKAHGYIAISQEVQNHLLKNGLSSKIIYNGIDCNRYKPQIPLRKKPRILSLCHSQEAHKIVEDACYKLNYDFSILDKYEDKKWHVEDIINQHDLIIGLGRSAYEALACGRPVIFFDKRTYGEAWGDGYFLYVLIESLKNNCSGRALKINFNAEMLLNELKKYNSKHGKTARNIALQSFNIKNTINEYFEYVEVIKHLIYQKTIKIRFKNTVIKIDTLFGNPITKLKHTLIPNKKHMFL